MSTLCWFAIRTKPRHEKAVSLTLAGKGYEQFLPVYSSRKLGSNPNRKPTSLPLFAGYLFCRFDVDDRLPILVTPGVFNIVGCGRAPIALDDVEIADLQSVVRAGIAPQPWPFLKVGHRVRIKRGALEGVEGVLVKSKSVDRLIVSITLLQRSVAVEIDSCIASRPRLFGRGRNGLRHIRWSGEAFTTTRPCGRRKQCVYDLPCLVHAAAGVIVRVTAAARAWMIRT